MSVTTNFGSEAVIWSTLIQYLFHQQFLVFFPHTGTEMLIVHVNGKDSSVSVRTKARHTLQSELCIMFVMCDVS